MGYWWWHSFVYDHGITTATVWQRPIGMSSFTNDKTFTRITNFPHLAWHYLHIPVVGNFYTSENEPVWCIRAKQKTEEEEEEKKVKKNILDIYFSSNHFATETWVGSDWGWATKSHQSLHSILIFYFCEMNKKSALLGPLKTSSSLYFASARKSDFIVCKTLQKKIQ